MNSLRKLFHKIMVVIPEEHPRLFIGTLFIISATLVTFDLYVWEGFPLPLAKPVDRNTVIQGTQIPGVPTKAVSKQVAPYNLEYKERKIRSGRDVESVQ